MKEDVGVLEAALSLVAKESPAAQQQITQLASEIRGIVQRGGKLGLLALTVVGAEIATETNA